MVKMKHVNISIYGIVQGVGFRFSAKHAAHRFNVKGFVKNQADGSVYIEAEGRTEQVNQFLAWCREGPSSARVRDLKVNEGEIKHFSSFEIGF